MKCSIGTGWVKFHLSRFAKRDRWIGETASRLRISRKFCNFLKGAVEGCIVVSIYCDVCTVWPTQLITFVWRNLFHPAVLPYFTVYPVIALWLPYLILFYLKALYKEIFGHSAFIANLAFLPSRLISIGARDAAIFQWRLWCHNTASFH